MPKIGNLTLGETPRVVLAVDEPSADLKDAARRGVAVLEIRVDHFPDWDRRSARVRIESFRQFGLPLLGTFRTKNQGGGWDGPESERKSLLLDWVGLFDAVDVELEAGATAAEVAAAYHAAGRTVIVSHHDFSATPADGVLESQISRAGALGADIVKLACTPATDRDVARLLRFIGDRRDRGLIGISMGPLGAISRVAGPLFGSLLTYTSPGTAYGQLSLEELVRQLRGAYPSFEAEFLRLQGV
jgi:3-dehydroquinate dehydratase-1